MHRFIIWLGLLISQSIGATLIVYFDGVDESQGRVLAFLHDNEAAYHSDDDTFDEDFRAFRFIRATAVAPMTQVTFRNIPPGRYVVSAYHDEDNDGALDRHYNPFMFLMPAESYGVSNNVYGFFSKASFEDALFDVTEPTTEITVHLSHHMQKILHTR